MRITQHFALDKTQPEVDFVDVDLDTDVTIFVDPRALHRFNTDWGQECIALIQDFFQCVLNHIRAGESEKAFELLAYLREPNETHLGFSRGQPRGRGLGPNSSRDVGEALENSEAARTGLLQDLEDTILMVPGVANDIVSDIATNVIRQPLVAYTQQMCQWYGIPLTPDVASGPMWDPQEEEWFEDLVPLPVVDETRLLLVPKAIVRRHMDFDVDKYYRHFVLPSLQNREAQANTELVKMIRGQAVVTKTSLIEKYGQGKEVAIGFTLENPQLLENYRAAMRGRSTPPLDHEGLAKYLDVETPDWVVLTLKSGPSGMRVLGHSHAGRRGPWPGAGIRRSRSGLR